MKDVKIVDLRTVDVNTAHSQAVIRETR